MSKNKIIILILSILVVGLVCFNYYQSTININDISKEELNMIISQTQGIGDITYDKLTSIIGEGKTNYLLPHLRFTGYTMRIDLYIYSLLIMIISGISLTFVVVNNQIKKTYNQIVVERTLMNAIKNKEKS